MPPGVCSFQELELRARGWLGSSPRRGWASRRAARCRSSIFSISPSAESISSVQLPKDRPANRDARMPASSHSGRIAMLSCSGSKAANADAGSRGSDTEVDDRRRCGCQNRYVVVALLEEIDHHTQLGHESAAQSPGDLVTAGLERR